MTISQFCIFRMGKKDRKERKLNAREKHDQKVRRNQQNANEESTEQDKELEKQLRQVGLALRYNFYTKNCVKTFQRYNSGRKLSLPRSIRSNLGQ